MLATSTLFSGLFSSLAFATPCDIDNGIAVGPITASPYDGDLGRGHRACPRNEAALGGGGQAVVDAANFYGHLQANFTLDGSLRVNERTEIFGALELFRYDQVIGAITTSGSGLGHTILGLSQLLVVTDNMAVSASGKVVLPTATALYTNAWPYSADLGVAGVYVPHHRVRVHGYASLLGTVGLSEAPGNPQVGAQLGLGAQVRVAGPVALVADVTGGFGYDAPVDQIAVSGAGRFVIRDAYGVEFGVTVPVAGRERSLATVDLRVTWRR
jgi:hypothetical protein